MHRKGFSLVELSIVLVILGLLVGGVLSGRSLIAAATIKSQISQIGEFSVAARTFRDKYFYLPGDLPEPTATSAGFKARGAAAGQGDGDGIISGWHGAWNAQYYSAGENLIFWTDLSAAKLIAGSFTTAVAAGWMPSTTNKTIMDLYFPRSKMGGNSVFVIGGSQGLDGRFIKTGKSYFGLQNVYDINTDYINTDGVDYGLSVAEAYMIDSKMDDGKPLSGKVGALYIDTWIIRSNPIYAPTALTASATTCIDNGNVIGTMPSYSMSINNGEGKNCALMFDAIN